MSNLFDVVIPVGPCDYMQVLQQLDATQKNVVGLRNIYLICSDPDIIPTQNDTNVIVVPETVFPFTKNDVARMHGEFERNGWYLQQLLKLYAGIVIPGILDRYLVIDCDTHFLKPTVFIDPESNRCLYNTGTEYHLPYFDHMKKLHPSLIKKHMNLSGICHHTMIETKYMRELIDLVEGYHNTESYEPIHPFIKSSFWEIYLRNVLPEYCGRERLNASGAAENEIYFNYVMIYHPNDVLIRSLNWANVHDNPNLFLNSDFSYVSWHYYMRR